MSLSRAILKLPGTHTRRGQRRTFVAAFYVLALLGASYYFLHSLGDHAPAAPKNPYLAGAGGSGGAVRQPPAKRPTKKRRPKQQQQVFNTRPSPFPPHDFRADGLLGVNPEGRHPIFDLVESAEKEWERKLARASKSLDEAVSEYRRRYGRAPPKGFDLWWDYVEAHNVQLPDEYDQIDRDLEVFWAIRPQDLRRLQLEQEALKDTFTVGKIGQHALGLVNLTLGGDTMQMHLKTAYEMMDILKPVEASLPPFRAVFSPHDNPSMVMSYQWKMLAREAVKEGRYLDLENPQYENLGWLSGCAPDSPARNTPFDLEHPPPPPISKTFIHDHYAAMDPCLHPRHLHIHGEYVAHFNGPPPAVPFVPIFALSTSPLHYDLRPATPLNWVEDVAGDPPWERKADGRLLWRGRNTGIWHGGEMRWRQQQRIRMVAMAGAKDGAVDVLLAGRADQRVASREMLVRRLNAELLDMAFVSGPIACEERFCEELERMFDFVQPMDWKAAGDYKYVMDMDGNGWSSRFKRLITSHSLVFKATGYPEWFTDRIAPWVHYVPVQLDLSDLYDTLIFFRGDVNGDGAHEAMAKKMAAAGREWSQRFWRKEDLTAYMFRLILEYARLMSFDRNAMSYSDPEDSW